MHDFTSTKTRLQQAESMATTSVGVPMATTPVTVPTTTSTLSTTAPADKVDVDQPSDPQDTEVSNIHSQETQETKNDSELTNSAERKAETTVEREC